MVGVDVAPAPRPSRASPQAGQHHGARRHSRGATRYPAAIATTRAGTRRPRPPARIRQCTRVRRLECRRRWPLPDERGECGKAGLARQAVRSATADSKRAHSRTIVFGEGAPGPAGAGARATSPRAPEPLAGDLPATARQRAGHATARRCGRRCRCYRHGLTVNHEDPCRDCGWGMVKLGVWRSANELQRWLMSARSGLQPITSGYSVSL